eukprot:6213254-Pleurochrysis_carterae.AAC.1
MRHKGSARTSFVLAAISNTAVRLTVCAGSRIRRRHGSSHCEQLVGFHNSRSAHPKFSYRTARALARPCMLAHAGTRKATSADA